MPINATPLSGIPVPHFSRYSAQEQLMLAQFAGQSMQVLTALAPAGNTDELKKMAADAFDMAEAMVEEYRKRTA